MRTHALKCWPEPFDAIVAGKKRFEFRRDDRGFAVGDILRLQKWDPSRGPGGYYFKDEDSEVGDPGCYPSIDVRVTYILRSFGVPDGYVVMSIETTEGTKR